MNQIRVRFAPSPTGHLHIGGARTALYNWLFAKKNKGKFILRIEDTDIERSTAQSINAIIDGLKWLGLHWDEGPDIGGEFGPYLQSKRLDIYRKYAEKLLNENRAYRCFCTPEEIDQKREKARREKKPYRYDGKCKNFTQAEIEKKLKESRHFTIRLKIEQDEEISFTDIIRGEIRFHTSNLDEFIIMRSDGFPVYNFAVVIDDALMKINYVIRGDDHISNTPRQILLYKSLGFPVPQFAHLPMILGEDKTRLSKRHGATAVQQFREMGYLPEAMINYLVRLGWGYDDTQEIFTIDELIEKFSLERVGKNPAVFNFKKLEWINGYYIQNLSSEDRTKKCIPFLIEAGLITKEESSTRFDYIKKIVEITGARLKLLSDITFYTDFFFKEKVEFSEDAINKTIKKFDLIPIYNRIIQELKQSEWKRESLINALENISREVDIKRKDFFQSIRVALTGKLISPDLIDIMLVIGKEKTLKRIEECIQFIEKEPGYASGN